MANKNTKAPHDSLVREHFQHPENAIGLLKTALPATTLAQLRLDTLEHRGLQLNTTALLKSVTDLVFTCKLQDDSDAFVHIVLEHKSQPDPLVAVQVLKYMTLIWDHYRRKNPSNLKLPFIIPCIFYHGQKEWEPRSLSSFFPQNSPLLAYVPVFTLPICNLLKVPEEELHKDILQNLMLILLKSILAQGTPAKIAAILHLLHHIHNNPKIIDTLELFFNYLSYIRQEISLDDIKEELIKLPNGGDMFQTFTEKMEASGFQKGILIGEQKGILIGEQKGILIGEQKGIGLIIFKLLSERFNSIPEQLSKKLQSIQDAEILCNLAEQIIKVNSLEEYEAFLDKVLDQKMQ